MGAVISWQRHINANVGRSDASICPPRTCVRDAGSSNQVTHSTVCADLSVVAAGLPSDCIVLLDALVEGARNEEYVFGSGRSRGGGPRLVQSLARRVHGRSLSSRARPAGARFVALTRRATPPFDVAMLEVDPLGAVHDCEAVAIGE
jgi:20S proteasome alpha/beta subunit